MDLRLPVAAPPSADEFDFRAASAAAAADERLKRVVNAAVMRQYTSRQERLRELPDADALRTLAGDIRQHAIDHLDYYLEQLSANLRQRGGQVHYAATAEDARRIIVQIAQRAGCTRCVKSKSMATEEVHLVAALQEAGIEAVETDLGEFILQIAGERPSHICAPAVHKDKGSIARLFSEYFGTPYNDDPTALTLQARALLRDKFRQADLGITGGNFLVAQSGQVCIITNEGNGRMTTTLPRVLVSLVGIEKVVPRLTDLAVMLKLLGRSSTGQLMTVYTNLFGGVRAAGEKDGPEEYHLVLLDAGRSEILAGPHRELLRCIRCGACLNACPVYRKIGGHAYGATYPGPIGAVVTPLLAGLADWRDLPQATTLCGGCAEACPVKIDLPSHLIGLRRRIVEERLNGFFERMIFRLWGRMLRSPFWYRLISWAQRRKLRKLAEDGWVKQAPAPMGGWTESRDLPAPPRKSFRQLWRRRKA